MGNQRRGLKQNPLFYYKKIVKNLTKKILKKLLTLCFARIIIKAQKEKEIKK